MSEQARSPWLDRLERLGPGLIVACAVLLRCTPPFVVNHDCGWYLYVADRVLAGDVLYRDIYAINPPWIVYLNVLPVVIARGLGVGVVPVFHAYVVAIAVVALWGSSLVLRRIASVRAGRRRVFLAGMAFVWLLGSGPDFGQREHLAIMLATPWLLSLLVPGRLPLRLGYGVGLLAGVGLAIKPHFVLAALLIRFFFGGRWFTARRPQTEGLLLVLVLYVLWLLVMPSRADFVEVLALLLQTNHGMNATWGEMFMLPWVVRSLALTLLLVGGLQMPQLQVPALRRKLWLVVGVALAFGAGALVQRKGWSYHFLPTLTALYCGLLALAVTWRFRAGLILVFLAVGSFGLGQHWWARDPESGELVREAPFTGLPNELALLAEVAPGKSVVVHDTDMPPFFAFLADRRIRWASPYAHLYPLPVAVADPEIWNAMVAAISASIVAQRPEIVAIRRGQPSFVRNTTIDLAERLRADPVVAAALAGYDREVGDAYDLYRRR